MNKKYLFVTGGVISSLGKGVTAASIALLLEKRGLKIAMIKLDPYLNVDPGTMNPFQHGEVYVTDDGAETDLDLGHYYRFTEAALTKNSSATTGQIYEEVIKRERRGDYLGKTVQVIPHVTDEIKRRILESSRHIENPDVVIVEIGGTVGDIESHPFLEAIRQFRNERPKNCLNIHLVYVPFLKAAGELKTKPAQHSVQTLRSIGILPDLLLCRSEQTLPEEIKDKLSLFCSVPKEYVMDEVDVDFSIYEVPLYLKKQRLDDKICSLLGLPQTETSLEDWEKILHTLRHPKGKVTIGIVGKYLTHKDAYKSVFEALHHAAIAHGVSLEVRTFESDKVTDPEMIRGCDGYLVPGGFGERGWMGKILTAKFCREEKIPYFGICLGMQVMCVEFARHVLGYKDANSTEVDADTPHPIISLLSEQQKMKNLGGTMRLGAYPCKLKSQSLAQRAYNQPRVSERHRHRYEFNNQFKEACEKHGLRQTGTLEEAELCEIVEVDGHPWMLGVQFHPEFKSSPTTPHPLFNAFIGAALEHHALRGH